MVCLEGMILRQVDALCKDPCALTQNIIIIIGASLLYVRLSILSGTADYAYGKLFNLKFISLSVCFAK